MVAHDNNIDDAIGYIKNLHKGPICLLYPVRVLIVVIVSSYRSVKPVSETAPARILWCVSGDTSGGVGWDSGIFDSSYLEEASYRGCQRLFQKFKKFGIYEWKHIGLQAIFL